MADGVRTGVAVLPRVGRAPDADRVQTRMKARGIDVLSTIPFAALQTLPHPTGETHMLPVLHRETMVGGELRHLVAVAIIGCHDTNN